MNANHERMTREEMRYMLTHWGLLKRCDVCVGIIPMEILESLQSIIMDGVDLLKHSQPVISRPDKMYRIGWISREEISSHEVTLFDSSTFN